MPDSDLVSYTEEDGIARLTINRPEKRNALNGGVIEVLQARFDALEAEERVRVVILTGAGSVFSAGADLQALRDLQTATPEENLEDSRRLAGLFERICRHPKPVIARVNGHAIAGGCGLASVCDFSIAVDTARLGFTEVRIGFVPAIVMVFVLRKLGDTAARDLLLRGRLVEARDAASIGLITRSVAEDQLDDTVDRLAHEIATQTSASAVAMTKQMLAEMPGMSLNEALEYAARMNTRARSTADFQAGLAAFLDKK